MNFLDLLQDLRKKAATYQSHWSGKSSLHGIRGCDGLVEVKDTKRTHKRLCVLLPGHEGPHALHLETWPSGYKNRPTRAARAAALRKLGDHGGKTNKV